MKKLLTLTFLGLNLMSSSLCANDYPNLSDIVPVNVKAVKDQQPVQQAAALILYVNANKNFRSLGQNFQIEFDANERDKFEQMLTPLPKGLQPMMKAFNDEALELTRDGFVFTLSNQANTSTFTVFNTNESTNYQFQKLIPAPYDGQTFMQQTSFNFRQYLKGNDTDPQIMELIVDYTLRLTILHRIYVYHDYINNPHALADTIEDIVQKVGEWESRHAIYKTPVYAAYIGWKNAKPETIAWVLERVHIDREDLKEIYQAYMLRADADEAIIRKYKMREFIEA